MKRRHLYLILLLCLSTGCESFLDEKPDKQQVVPSTLPDLQALLDRYNVINGSDPGTGETSADNYYLTDASWSGLPREDHRRLYTWEKDNLFASGSNDWSSSYQPVFTANTVLEQLNGILREPANTTAWDNVKGQALFIRAKSFLQIVTLWSQAYEERTAAVTLGIPLRLSPEFHDKSSRSSLQQTFDQVLADLKEAARLLPETPVHPVRPSKAAAYALLARASLYLHRYNDVESYADATLQLHNRLLDFNTLKPSVNFPVPQANQEVIYRSYIPIPTPLNASRAKVDSTLYKSYAAEDLRKAAFFRNVGNGAFAFKGSYEGNNNLFSGVATDEVYLMRAEARARQGKVEQAMEDLNTLLVTRWVTGTFVPFTAANNTEALEIILRERRKELLMRGLRWMDLKRLNLLGANITLTRRLNGQTYTLPPNDLRYALPLPEDVIELSGMVQNPR